MLPLGLKTFMLGSEKQHFETIRHQRYCLFFMLFKNTQNITESCLVSGLPDFTAQAARRAPRSSSPAGSAKATPCSSTRQNLVVYQYFITNELSVKLCL